MNYYKSLALFAGGVLFGSAGIKLLSSKDAKKVYTHTTAAALRMKDCVMGTVTTVQENAADIWPVQRISTRKEPPGKRLWRMPQRRLRQHRRPEYISKNGRYDTDRGGGSPLCFPLEVLL